MSQKGSRRAVLVTDGDHGLPYSKGLTANTIMASGLAPARAYQVAQAVEDRLVSDERHEIDKGELRRIIADVIRVVAGDRYAAAYEKWQVVTELGVPLVILIGGATGVGKSTIATQLAARLGIPRVSSTDAIREVMKGTFSKDFMPTLYKSSFDTADVVSHKIAPGDDAVLVGFRDQVSAVAVGVDALIQRAVTESTDVIVEGAHIVPGFLHEDAFGDRAVIVPMVIQVEDEDLHRSHFQVRGIDTRHRPMERYLEHFENIRKIQKYIKSLALQHGVPLISNFNVDASIRQAIDLVIDRATTAATAGARAEVRHIRKGTA